MSELQHAFWDEACAHALTGKLCGIAAREGKNLIDIVHADPQAAAAIDAKEIADLFNPESCFGSAPAMIERALAQRSRCIGT